VVALPSVPRSTRAHGGVFSLKQKLTNRLSLPEPIVRALQNDPYDSGDSDYTPSSLNQPARMRRILQLDPDGCVEDASERIDSLFGQAVHLILERAAKELEAEGYVVEKRFHGTFPVDGRIYRVSAQVDLYDPAKGALDDYKTTSAESVSHGLKEEHKFQINLQAELLRRHGFPVDSAHAVGLLKNWNPDKADVKTTTYPQAPCVKLIVPLLSSEEVVAWVTRRIREHAAASKASTQAELPQCTTEETWTRTEDDSWAVQKPGASRAYRLFETREGALQFVKENPEYLLEERLGKAVRCSRWCPARRVCEQWRTSPRNNGKAGTGSRPKRRRSSGMVLPDDFEVA
jgi:hypothetical protein